ncbi:MAG: 30S ribosome-binding factor RbfA [Deltaproteobacteria bacterium]|nr:30S ribosome-binding factor RbfA [Deltaproteobacteria bacterium]
MGTRRTKRLGQLIQAELAELLLRRVKDPRVKGVTLTGVDVSPDLSQAKVFFSCLDPDAERAAAQEGLTNAAPFLRRELAGRLSLKTVPRLLPVYDESLARGAELDLLIRRVRAEDDARAQARDDEEETPES